MINEIVAHIRADERIYGDYMDTVDIIDRKKERNE